MRVDELFSHNDDKKELDFDLIDDLIFFIQNDHNFYRTDYYPFISKFHKYLKSGAETSPSLFKNIVLRAYNVYRSKFNVDGLDDKLTIEQIKEVCNKLYNLEHSTARKEK